MTTAAEWVEAFPGELVPVCHGRHQPCLHPGKVPHARHWQTRPFAPSMLRAWRGNLGLRTRAFPALDLDVEDPALADELERVALLTLGSTARRTRSNTARRLLLYRLEGAAFGKAKVAFAGGAVEILADGQQAVVHGTHASAAALEWRAGVPSPAALAPMSLRGRDDLLTALRRRLAEIGVKVEGPPSVERRAPRPAQAPTSRDAEIAELALRRLDPDADYGTWLRIGMALHARWPDGAGLALWDAWSGSGQKYPGRAELERHWDSFRAGAIGFGTLLYLGKRAP